MRTFHIEPDIFRYEADLKMMLRGKLRDHPSSIGLGSTDIHKKYFTWKIDWLRLRNLIPKEFLLNPNTNICMADEAYKFLTKKPKHIRPAQDTKEFKGQLMTVDQWTINTTRWHLSGYITDWNFPVMIADEVELYTPETRYVIVNQRSLFNEIHFPIPERYLKLLPDHPYVMDIQNSKIVEINSINHADLKDFTLAQVEIIMEALEEATR